ncbi:hypothetical protein P7D52_12570 [Enterococcus dongliensis]|uniref:DUF1659 domain-containing protein n=1 Tax=Enterococcus dongliensis TaxID=2559925 RepID=A0AAP5KTR8_9ENTE|nr:hypothetical protein [Enterococcus dongliensis]MDT2597927.1 hypothetical protein [Enterococcus dongliensis]MDT2604893.1 hypothetical protein [Enterococcus dongliensis]MDT2612655.1 hypothetical protein [Enterococcus dongliensis]MDT2635845.1 hypothetical protein [Enterococcus dongliensis]MDT2638378.1 hypothetical protein [Enterococcus dongliensis]
MIQKIGNKLQVQLETADGNKQNINFSHVIATPTEEKILALGDVLVNLSKDKQLDSIVLTEQSRITK